MQAMSVIFSRAPLRISLGGGGTDLPSYYREHGGFLVSGAIDKYVYMLTHTVFQRRYRMKYSEIEEVDDVGEIRHPILRETLLRHWRGNPLEIASVADVPAGTGMGSSGAYTVCLLKGLAHARRTSITPGALAEAACEIEIDVLGEPVGKQDQYVAAHGGICAYTLPPRRQRRGRAARARRRRRCAGCATSCCSFYTGEARSASAVLADQDERSRAGDAAMLENLHRTKEIGLRSRELLEERRPRCATPSSCTSTGRTSASARPGWRTSGSIDLYTLARRSGVHRRQARRRRRRRLPARLRAATRRTRVRRWRRPERHELAFDFEFDGRVRERERMSRAPAARRDRRLRA